MVMFLLGGLSVFTLWRFFLSPATTERLRPATRLAAQFFTQENHQENKN
jgi:hypothetical protein